MHEELISYVMSKKYTDQRVNEVNTKISTLNNALTSKPSVQWLSTSSVGYKAGDTVLPTTGNELGDYRKCLENSIFYMWTKTGTNTFGWTDTGDQGYGELKDKINAINGTLDTKANVSSVNQLSNEKDNLIANDLCRCRP